MPDLVPRPFHGEGDFALLIDFARRTTVARGPQPAFWHPGDVVWQLYLHRSRSALDDWRLWFDSTGLAAVANLDDGIIARWEIRPDLEAGMVLDEILAWAEDRRRQVGHIELPRAYAALEPDALVVQGFDSNVAQITALTAAGYHRSEHFEYHFRRSLDEPIAHPKLPAGMRLRNATDADIEARADLHRAAWSVWGPSSFSADMYRQLRESPLYELEFDVVLADGDGRLLSYCICWPDKESGIGRFEPVGTRPDATGKGLGKATVIEGLRRLRGQGMRAATVSTAGVNEGAKRLYLSCGFDIADHSRSYSKRLW